MTNPPRTIKTAFVLTLALAAFAPGAASARPAGEASVRTTPPTRRVAGPKPTTAAPMSAAMVAHRSEGPFVRTVTPADRGTASVESAQAVPAPTTGIDWTLGGLLAGGALLLSALGGLWLRQRRPGPARAATVAG